MKNIYLRVLPTVSSPTSGRLSCAVPLIMAAVRWIVQSTKESRAGESAQEHTFSIRVGFPTFYRISW